MQIGAINALTLIFVTLKLTGVIDWSWWWVLAPTWMSLAAFILILVGCCVVAVFADEWRRR